MIEINKKLNLKESIQKFFNSNKKNIFLTLFSILIIFLLYQFYIYYKNIKVLQVSILYNESKNLESLDDFNKNLEALSKENNFYGILSSMNLIKNKLENKNIDESYNSYIILLENKDLSNIFLSAIATHACYNLLNHTNNKNLLDVENKITNLLTFIDPSLISYKGFKLEILYLLEIYKQENNYSISNDDYMNLYNQIINDDDITSDLKERVTKIHDFQKNK